MASNLSSFPEKIDSFMRHFDAGSVDIANVQQYQTLRVKDSLTSAETEQMNKLFSALRDKLWLAEDLNKIQDAITNLETFFKYQTETYIAEVFAAYDDRMNKLEADSQDLQNTLQNVINDGNSWINSERAGLHDSNYFDFDNMSYRAGFTLRVEKTDTGYNETLLSTDNKAVYATRITTKNGESDYTFVTVCDKVSPPVNIQEHTYKENGVWRTVVTTP